MFLADDCFRHTSMMTLPPNASYRPHAGFMAMPVEPYRSSGRYKRGLKVSAKRYSKNKERPPGGVAQYGYFVRRVTIAACAVV